MEDLATKNVEKVSNVADHVTQHNKKSWRSTLATWTILFAVLGSFLFCMMTIRMVPKQRNKCLFFCQTQKEVCNRMEDGSIVCVDTQGNPYIKKHAPVSRREAEERKEKQECDAGDNDGECVAPLETDSNDEQDKSVQEAVHESKQESDVEKENTSDDVCNEDGECKAQYNDEPDVTDGETQTNDGEDNTEIKVDLSKEEQEHRQALEQVVGATNADNASSLNVADATIGNNDPNENLPRQYQESEEVQHVNHEHVEEDAVVDEGEESSGNTHDDLPALEDHDSMATETMERSYNEPAEEPMQHAQETRNNGKWPYEEHRQEPQPTLESPQSAVEKEAHFKPAEISAQYKYLSPTNHETNAEEKFDDDGNRIMDAKIDFTADDVRLQAHFGNNEVLRRYLYLMPHFASLGDINGWQCIHEAANAGNIDTMELLLNDYNVDINARAGLVNDGATPLFLAYKRGYDDSSEVVRYIKSRGGVSIGPGEQAPYKPKSEHTPEELEQYNMQDLHLAAARGDDIRVAQYLVARRDLVEAEDENGWRAIHEAVRYGHFITTQLLINAGADINALTANNDGWSPLALAIKRFGEDHPATRLLRTYNAVAHFPRE